GPASRSLMKYQTAPPPSAKASTMSSAFFIDVGPGSLGRSIELGFPCRASDHATGRRRGAQYATRPLTAFLPPCRVTSHFFSRFSELALLAGNVLRSYH